MDIQKAVLGVIRCDFKHGNIQRSFNEAIYYIKTSSGHKNRYQYYTYIAAHRLDTSQFQTTAANFAAICCHLLNVWKPPFTLVKQIRAIGYNLINLAHSRTIICKHLATEIYCLLQISVAYEIALVVNPRRMSRSMNGVLFARTRARHTSLKPSD